ncbi:MAG: isoprenylcysteine carboxylmethyltransferase family protein [Desulfobacteraceae bacterium]|nr:isoprenylcysteine carboxylmethyltransferase family protein [Desulfobacteraceae bacterium]
MDLDIEVHSMGSLIEDLNPYDMVIIQNHGKSIKKMGRYYLSIFPMTRRRDKEEKMNFKAEKYRIVLSRITAAVVLFFFCTTQSYWETEYEIIRFFLFLIGIILVAISALGRMWCSLYIAGYKDDQLIIKGPYSICRNPLYFFSMIGVIGIGFATETFTFPIVFILLFILYYPFVIKSEENRLKQIFGTQFEEYTRKVPAFFPRFSIFEEPESYIVNPIVYRKHIFSALWFIWIVGILEVIEGMRQIGLIGHLWSLY